MCQSVWDRLFSAPPTRGRNPVEWTLLRQHTHQTCTNACHARVDHVKLILTSHNAVAVYPEATHSRLDLDERATPDHCSLDPLQLDLQCVLLHMSAFGMI